MNKQEIIEKIDRAEEIIGDAECKKLWYESQAHDAATPEARDYYISRVQFQTETMEHKVAEIASLEEALEACE